MSEMLKMRQVATLRRRRKREVLCAEIMEVGSEAMLQVINDVMDAQMLVKLKHWIDDGLAAMQAARKIDRFSVECFSSGRDVLCAVSVLPHNSVEMLKAKFGLGDCNGEPAPYGYAV